MEHSQGAPLQRKEPLKKYQNNKENNKNKNNIIASKMPLLKSSSITQICQVAVLNYLRNQNQNMCQYMSLHSHSPYL